MTSPAGDTPSTLGNPRLEVRWQARPANFLENCHVALLGPRLRPGSVSPSYFRLRMAPRRVPGPAIAGSLVCHAILVALLVPLGQLAEPALPVSLPQIQITWYGPAADVAPHAAPKPSQPKSPRRRAPKPKAPLLARAYNAKTTVIFKPPRATNTRQVLIEPEAPPTPPLFLPSIPNIITWASAQPVQPAIEVNPEALVARRSRKGSVSPAAAPQIAAAMPLAGPLAITPPSATPQPPLPLAPGVIRAQPRKASPKSAAAPTVTFTANRLVALSLTPGGGVPPPGNASAPMSIGPRVGKTSSSAAPNIAMDAGPNPGGNPAADSALPGPAGLLILNEGASPAPPPAPRAPAVRPVPRIAPISPLSPLSIARRTARPDVAAGSGIFPHDLAHEILGMRPIHRLLMNMPNLTSATGSWVLDFAELPGEKIPVRGAIAAPLPIRKVDPEYPPEQIQQGVQGEVVLYAVIGKDGTVSHIRVVKGLDPVLDRNAEAAFAKWKFLPALADHNPIDLEVLVHIPFHYQAAPDWEPLGK